MNALYNSARSFFLNGSLSWSNNTIRVAMVDTSVYNVNLASDVWLSIIPTRAITGTSSPLDNKTSTNGVANSNPASFPAVNGNAGAMVVYADSGAASSSPLIAYIDTANGIPAAFTANAVTIQWDVGTNKIFSL